MTKIPTRERFLTALHWLEVACTRFHGCSDIPIEKLALDVGETRAEVIAAYGAMAGRIAELETMLRSLEWSGGEPAPVELCPICGADSYPEGEHEPGCELAALLEPGDD